MVSALYLTKPLYINIAGGFSYGNEENLLQYNEDDLKQAGVYFARFVQIFNARKTTPRPYYVLKAFFEATLWEHSIYASTSFSKLFPLIDSFTGNPTHKHEKQASTRLNLFLKEVPSRLLDKPLPEEEIKSRLASIWQLHRAPDLHGYLKEPDLPSSNGSNKKPVDNAELKDL